MKILIFGAGILGCDLANSFYKAKKDVTLLVRGERGKIINDKGLVIKSLIFKSTDRIKTVEKLEPSDEYDVIFVTMRFNQIENIISDLRMNSTKNIVFVGNNMKARDYEKLLADKNMWFAFSTSTGKKTEEYTRCLSLHKITIGSAIGECKNKDFIENIFAGTNIKTVITDDMDEWLKAHAAFILPLVNACYANGGSLKKIKNDDQEINKIIDETKNNYDSLINNGFKILPDGDYDYVTKDRAKCFKFVKLMCKTSLGKICICEHAMNAKDEFKKLQDELNELKVNKTK